MGAAVDAGEAQTPAGREPRETKRKRHEKDSREGKDEKKHKKHKDEKKHKKHHKHEKHEKHEQPMKKQDDETLFDDLFGGAPASPPKETALPDENEEKTGPTSPAKRPPASPAKAAPAEHSTEDTSSKKCGGTINGTGNTNSMFSSWGERSRKSLDI